MRFQLSPLLIAFLLHTPLTIAPLTIAIGDDGKGDNENRESQRRPNMVLVMADDQGWGDMAYNGHPVLKTPNFDAAAAEGLRFDRFYAAAPVCSPTRASVMTGRTPNRAGVLKWGYPLRPQEFTLAEALKTAGYATAHFGKWHLGSVRHNSPASPGACGFDHWVSAPNFFDNDPILSVQGKAEPFTGESSIITVDIALDWIQKQSKSDAPFFAVVWFGSPHSPHQASAEDKQWYQDQTKPLQEFYGEVTGMDRAFGKLIQGLESNGVRDDTILWYCSDNGALPRVGSAGGLRGRKADVYEGGLMVPAILQWPAKIKAPKQINTRCTTSDIYPTLLDIGGVDIGDQPELDGVSLKPLLQGMPFTRSRPLGFWDYSSAPGISTPSAKLMSQLLQAQENGGDLSADEPSMNAAVLPSPAYPTDVFPGHAAWIDEDWKLHRIEQKGGVVRWELYDLATDPNESRNVAEDHDERVAEMRGQLEAWLTSVVHSLNGDDYRD